MLQAFHQFPTYTTFNSPLYF